MYLAHSICFIDISGPYLVVHTGTSKKYISIDNSLDTLTTDRTFIQFDFKGEMGAALRLTNQNADFEIIIGANFNTKSVIQVPGESSPKHARFTSKLLSKADFRQFYVSWLQGKITVGRGTEIGRNVFMTYSALSSTPVFSISVATSEGKEGEWKFKRGNIMHNQVFNILCFYSVPVGIISTYNCSKMYLVQLLSHYTEVCDVSGWE